MLFKVYGRFVPNLTRQDGSAFERLLTATLGSADKQMQSPTKETSPDEMEVNHG